MAEWYESVEAGEIPQQGELIRNIPLLDFTADYLTPTEGGVVDINVVEYNVVLITHSCDIAQNNVELLQVCSYYQLSEFIESKAEFNTRSKLSQLLDGKFGRYLVCEQGEDYPTEPLVVDLSQVFTVRRTYVEQYIAIHGSRLRLKPPYREFLSQAFARFFMRVALPRTVRESVNLNDFLT